ncbi:hypothetical protein [Promicromonospora sukumoe]|uniref:Uncharacterized protein YjaG (DUF416 family) n=1 Tax=Promicromonospora sukumoe TaxID=88382 RepID=A0A7W3PG62_9MICO|nr:hypothetical protein [Promicromonospora sukumoe]MBA8810284.1 uncharacterized protein YjaG (DUF416 family) [Promicromonospora sukumoe]
MASIFPPHRASARNRSKDISLAANPFVDRLIRQGATSQKLQFAAACAERSAGVLFWAASLDDRMADADLYGQILDKLWSGVAKEGEWDRLVERIEGTSDLVDGHERGGAYSYAFSAGALMHSCLNFARSMFPSGLPGIAEEATNNASRIGFRVGVNLIDEELSEQMRDANAVLLSAAMPSAVDLLRERARTIGRGRLSALKKWGDENGL